MDDALKLLTTRPIDVPRANQLLNTLRQVLAVEDRMREANVRPQHPQSQLTQDLAAGNAAFTFAAAGNAVGTAIDHLHAWYNLIACDLEKLSMPIMAHYTLARAVYEPSLQALWMLDPSLDNRTRIGRGYAMELQSHTDMLKFQQSTERTPEQHTARDFIDLLMKSAAEDGLLRLDRHGTEILTVGAPNMVDIFNKYEGPEPAGRNAEWRWRMLSGLAHGRRWAVVGNSAEVETATDDGYLLRPNWDYLQVFAQFAVSVASRAADAFVTYRCAPVE